MRYPPKRFTGCGASTVFWPDEEACDAVCKKQRNHKPENIHEDEILGEWDENEMNTREG